MNECKFCKFEENGDIPQDREDLFDDEVNLSIKMKAKICFNIPCLSEEESATEVSNTDSILPIAINIGLQNGNELIASLYETNYGVPFYEVVKDINYCPICGRKLTKFEES